jgi:CheY-like chemotaxis protein
MHTEPFDQSFIIADNDSTMRGILRSVLQEPRRAVFLAADGLEAVEYAEHVVADLILLDVRMPKLDGLDACARIRDMPRYKSVPIMILSAYDNEVARRKAKRLGATAFVAKPFSTDGLLRQVASLVHLREERAAVRQ